MSILARAGPEPERVSESTPWKPKMAAVSFPSFSLRFHARSDAPETYVECFLTGGGGGARTRARVCVRVRVCERVEWSGVSVCVCVRGYSRGLCPVRVRASQNPWENTSRHSVATQSPLSRHYSRHDKT